MSEIKRIDQKAVDSGEIREPGAVADKSPASGSPVSAGGQLAEISRLEGGTDNFITIDDFLKVELIVGEVKVCERIPKADKLLRFEIDLGEEQPRQILAGLAEFYEPEMLIGRKVVVVANLKPRQMRGLESQGMICAASLEDGSGEKPALATFIENVDIGARLK